MSVNDQMIDVGSVTLHIREWAGNKPPFVLLHGLASNCMTWEGVARHLAEAGHHVITADQRGHGLSEKPDEGYTFATITGDLCNLLDTLALDQPIIAGQSWGGNVVLEFGARYPGRTRGIAFVDGGFFDLQDRPNNDWESVRRDLKPPNLVGSLRKDLAAGIRAMHPDWSDEGIEHALANFETLPDGTIRPWLTQDRHLRILRAMWEQRPKNLYGLVQEPVLICPAFDVKNPEWSQAKVAQVKAAQDGLATSTVHWFDESDHDIHIQRPAALAELFLKTLADGIWAH